MALPTALVTWDSTDANTDVPDSSQQSVGYGLTDYPTAGVFNYLFKGFAEHCQYLQGGIWSDAHTWTGLTNYNISSASNLLTVTNTGTGDGIYASSSSGLAIEAVGWDSGGSFEGLKSTDGTNVYGVTGRCTSSGTGERFGVWGLGGTVGVYGEGANRGVRGVSTNGYGVLGESTNTYGGVFTGTTGVYGNGSATNGYGVYGIGSGASGLGVLGNGNAEGVRGTCESTNGIGVKGSATGSTSTGVYGTGTNVGVQGTSASTGACRAVEGITTTGNSSSNGVYGASTNGIGAYGSGGVQGVYGTGPTGVYGTGSNYGVEGVSTAIGVYGHGGATGGNFNGSTNGVYAFSSAGAGLECDSTTGCPLKIGIKSGSTPPSAPVEGGMFVTTTPSPRIYVYLSGTWRYANLT